MPWYRYKCSQCEKEENVQHSIKLVGSEHLNHCWFQLDDGSMCGGKNTMRIIPHEFQTMRLPSRAELKQRALAQKPQFEPGSQVKKTIEDTKRELREMAATKNRKDFEV